MSLNFHERYFNLPTPLPWLRIGVIQFGGTHDRVIIAVGSRINVNHPHRGYNIEASPDKTTTITDIIEIWRVFRRCANVVCVRFLFPSISPHFHSLPLPFHCNFLTPSVYIFCYPHTPVSILTYFLHHFAAQEAAAEGRRLSGETDKINGSNFGLVIIRIRVEMRVR